MDDLKVALIAGIAMLITTFFTELKEIVKFLVTKGFKKLTKKQVDVSKHSIFTNINNYLERNKYKVYSSNRFKQLIITNREEIIWNLIINNLKEITSKEIDELTLKEFILLIDKMTANVDTYKNILLKEGVSEKVLNVMEANIVNINLFVKNLIDKILYDDIYDSNSERFWAILTIYNEYLMHLNQASIDSLLKANGALLGETYKGVENDGTY
jgi:hypothetical protein